MTNIELFPLITKQFVSTKEIKLIAECGINKANDIRKEIKKTHCKDKILPKNKIPTKYLLQELDISIKEVSQKAKMEKELKGEIQWQQKQY